MVKRQFIISCLAEELLIETEADDDQLRDDTYLATDVDTGELLLIRGWLVDHLEPWPIKATAPAAPFSYLDHPELHLTKNAPSNRANDH